MRIDLNRTRCEGYGFCEEEAPDVFRLDDEGELTVLSPTVAPDQLALVESAVRACPVAALSLERD